MPGGRPSKYTPEMVERVCEVIETTSGSLEDAFNARDDLPTYRTVLNWERDHAEFLPRLSRAREIRAHVMVENALAIADESEHDTITKTGRNGEEYESPNSEWMARSRLRYESRKWHASKLNARVYGDKAALDIGGQPGNPLKTESTTVRVDPDSLPEEDRAALMRIVHRNLQGAS